MIIKLCCGDSVPILVLAMVTTPSCIPNLLRFFMKLRSFFLSASSMVAWTEAMSPGQPPARLHAKTHPVNAGIIQSLEDRGVV